MRPGPLTSWPAHSQSWDSLGDHLAYPLPAIQRGRAQGLERHWWVMLRGSVGLRSVREGRTQRDSEWPKVVTQWTCSQPWHKTHLPRSGALRDPAAVGSMRKQEKTGLHSRALEVLRSPSHRAHLDPHGSLDKAPQLSEVTEWVVEAQMLPPSPHSQPTLVEEGLVWPGSP